MYAVTNLVVLALAATAVTANPLQKRADYTIDTGSGDQCGAAGGVHNHLTGSATTCYPIGGNSISAVGGCQVYTTSGADCNGSQQQISTGGDCVQVPFAGIRVVC
ncbi:hypothetical protein NA57DRAFT_80184 [Rhizodiscina lignyota]|uniref:Uncharacterized protein n=1 Tax=Rhizodiscina lignyota TaxID=1504668 RepID=A0A9P4I3L8_9PEZI|nr:hypothetical protein NA57DRAFT_80184 [Rhizodiscina lignyota]